MANGSWRQLIFDLDNTLYPPQCGLLDRIDRQIDDYLIKRLCLEQTAVTELRRKYFEKYGTTLRGVKEHHGVDPIDYTSCAYDVDPKLYIQPDPLLREMLRRLPWPKAVLSNSPEDYVWKVLEALGIAGEFIKVYGIHFSSHLGKPDPETYRLVLADLDVPASACVMIDDAAVNLIPAHDLGMTTVFFGQPKPAWADHCLVSLLDLEGILFKESA